MAKSRLLLLSLLPLISAAPTPPMVSLANTPSAFVLSNLACTSAFDLRVNSSDPSQNGPLVTLDFTFADPDAAYETSNCSTAWTWNAGPPYGRIIPCLGNTDMGFALPLGSFNATNAFSLVLSHYVPDADAAEQLTDAAAAGNLTAYNQTQIIKRAYLDVTSTLVNSYYNPNAQYPISQSYQPPGNKTQVPISSVELSVLNALTITS